MNDTVLMVKSEPVHENDEGIKADAEALKYYDEQMLGSAT